MGINITTPVVVEPANVPEIWCDGIAWVERKGECCRIVFYSEEHPLGEDGPVERKIVLKMIGSNASVPGAVETLVAFIATVAKSALVTAATTLFN